MYSLDTALVLGFKAPNRAQKRRMSKNKENDVEHSQGSNTTSMCSSLKFVNLIFQFSGTYKFAAQYNLHILCLFFLISRVDLQKARYL